MSDRFRISQNICRSMTLLVLFSALSIALGRPAFAAGASDGSAIQHVILISLDGFHDFDLTRYVATHPNSAMARLVNSGIVYANAYTTGPSDSYPGSLALTTGGTPVSTGILYDNSWDDTLSPPGSR